MITRTLLAVLAAILVSGCATTSPTSSTSPETPPTMHMIEGRPDSPSAMDDLQRARFEVDVEKTRAADLEKQNEELRAERDDLRRQLAETDGILHALRTEADRLDRDKREATEKLLASELEKAKLERRLLEIRLADLRKANEESAR